MTIILPKETLEKWKSLRGKGDIENLCKETNLSRSAVYYILSNGKCTSKAIAAKVIKYHSKLESDIKQLTQELNQD